MWEELSFIQTPPPPPASPQDKTIFPEGRRRVCTQAIKTQQGTTLIDDRRADDRQGVFWVGETLFVFVLL